MACSSCCGWNNQNTTESKNHRQQPCDPTSPQEKGREKQLYGTYSLLKRCFLLLAELSQITSASCPGAGSPPAVLVSLTDVVTLPSPAIVKAPASPGQSQSPGMIWGPAAPHRHLVKCLWKKERLFLWTTRSALFERGGKKQTKPAKFNGRDGHVLWREGWLQTCAVGSSKRGCLRVTRACYLA